MISHPFPLIPACLVTQGLGKRTISCHRASAPIGYHGPVSQCPPFLAPKANAPEPLFAVRNGLRRRFHALGVLQLLLVDHVSLTVRAWTAESLLELGLLRFLPLIRLLVFSCIIASSSSVGTSTSIFGLTSALGRVACAGVVHLQG